MNTNEVAIRCGEHAFTRLQKLLPQQDRLLPKIYQTTDDQYVIYWDNIYWYETYNSNEAEIVNSDKHLTIWKNVRLIRMEISYLVMNLNF